MKAVYWAVRCGWPGKKLKVIGVTGTDGKTTTCTLIYEMLKLAGFKVGMVTTVGVKYKSLSSEVEFEKGLHSTNPGAEILQPLLKKMKDEGVTHIVLEVTSHGLDQNRVWGIDFCIGVLTNITHEHLDYHKNFDNYKQAKMKLFAKVKHCVLNRDDPSYEFFKSKVEAKSEVIGYTKTKIKDISHALAGDYNKYNIAAAVEVARILKIDTAVINDVVKNMAGVSGRREEVKAGQPFRIIVDFAHTPNALEQLLESFKAELGSKKSKIKNRLILVFGCTGERDKEKRPMMGEVAARLADVVIVTSDDTRSESQDDIYDQIAKGFKGQDVKLNTKIFKENDRRQAISKAIGMAKAGDVVILAGKGHEKSILLGKIEYPWSDVSVAKEEIDKKYKA